MNVAIIGAGFMGSMHASIIDALDDVTLLGICGKTPERASAVAHEKGIKCYESVEMLLGDTSVDIVDICSPTNTHAQLAVMAMNAGKHVIVEFPVCETEDELERMLSAQKATNTICAAAYYSRYQAQLSYLFNSLKQKDIGEINDIYISRRSQDYFASADIVNNLMSQDIDFIVRLLGIPKQIMHSNTNQDYALFIFEYEKTKVIIEGATNMHRGFPFTIKATASGTKGSIDFSWRFTDKPEYDYFINLDEKTETLQIPDYDPYEFELQTILKGMRVSKMDSMSTIESVAESAKLAFRCREMI